MDNNTFYLLIVVVLAALAVIAMLLFRKRSKIDINTPVGGIKIDGENGPFEAAPPRAKIDIKNTQSTAGGIMVKGTGDIKSEDAKAKKDIEFSQSDPKANPPA